MSESSNPSNAPTPVYHSDDPCPKCSDGILDYDEMLNLVCMSCGYIAELDGGCST